MADEKKEQPFIEPKGTEGLHFKGFVKPGETTDEKAAAGTGEAEPQEEILTLEEMKQRFPKLKVKMSVAGEEKILSADELGQHYQLTHGRERTIEQRNTESARLQEETRRLHAQALELVGTTVKAKADEQPAGDPDDPGVFVDTRVKGAIETAVLPQIEALTRTVESLREAVEPTIEDAQTKRAKTLLVQDGINPSGFDEYRQARIDGLAEKAGRPLTAKEIAGVSAERWVIDYERAIARGQVKPKAKAEEEPPEKPPVRRTVTVKTVGAGGGSGGGGYTPQNGSVDQSLKSFATGTQEERAAHLIKKGVRPWGSTQGG